MRSDPLVLVFDPPPPPKTADEVHAAAMARGADCKNCPLFGCNRGPVMPTIRPNAPLIAIGEAPGENEYLKGEGFVGASGKKLDASIEAGGLTRNDISISNTILCMPDGGNFTEYLAILRASYVKARKRWEKQWLGSPGDGELSSAKRTSTAVARWERACKEAKTPSGVPEPPPEEPVMPQVACRPRLERDLAESKSLVTLAVGKQALEATSSILGLATTKDKSDGKAKVASIKKQHGAPVLLPDGRVLMATYHPAFAMHDKCEYMPVIEENIARAARIARRNGKIEWSEPNYILSPDPALIKRTLHGFLRNKTQIAVDIETNSIDPHTCQVRCVGIGGYLYGQEVIMSIPFRHMDGSLWWDIPTRDEIGLLLRRVVDECPLIFQNGQYDTTVLLRVGLMTNRAKQWDDTLLLHHDTPDNDLPHDLGFITRRYFECPLWKENVDHKSVDPSTDYYLHLYNCRDVLATLRVYKPLAELVQQYNTVPQYITDRRMAVRTRDMSELGLMCNEWLRGKYSTHLNKQCTTLIREFQAIAGRSINPRSPPQLRELFYGDWDYLPVVATDGYEWEEEVDDREDGSTSNNALTRLVDERIKDPKHLFAIDKLLEFRAVDKTRGTNIDNLKTYDVDWPAHGFTGLYDVGWVEPVRGLVYDKDTDTEVEREILPRRRGLSLVRTTYKGYVVPTGRLASGDPVNFQNIPIAARGGLNMRGLYFAPPGHVFVGADYEQIEARLYAIIAHDKLLLKAIFDFDPYRNKQGYDIHALNAASLFCKPGDDLFEKYVWILNKPKDDFKYIRTVAKRFCFGLIYGAGWEKIFQVMISDRNKATGKRTFPDLKDKDCQEWEANWHRLHPETQAWHKRCHAAFDEYHFTGVPMLDYRKRFFPGGVAQKNAIPNLTIQGSAASIANRALLALAEEIPYRGWSHWSGIALQVHDYIGVIVPEARAYEAKKILERCMYFKYEGMEFNAFAEITWDWGSQ